MAYKDIADNVYGKLTVIRKKSKSSNGDYIWECLCECGSYCDRTIGSLNCGRSLACKSCSYKDGWSKREDYHGLSNSPEYKAWCKIKERCLNSNDKGYPRYGGSGITISEEWKNDFLSFYNEVGQRPSEDHSIDRIDCTKGYESGNIRWASKQLQTQNKRAYGKIKYKGVSYEDSSGKYLCQIKLPSKFRSSPIKVGRFETAEDAANAWDLAVMRLDYGYPTENLNNLVGTFNPNILKGVFWERDPSYYLK